MGGATHQLLVADGEVRHLSPAHRHRVKAAVWFPAEDPQRVRGAAVQAGAIWAKTYTPETTGTGVRGQRSHSSYTLLQRGKTHLTGVVSPSNEPIIVNFSRSHSLMVLQAHAEFIQLQLIRDTCRCFIVSGEDATTRLRNSKRPPTDPRSAVTSQ